MSVNKFPIWKRGVWAILGCAMTVHAKAAGIAVDGNTTVSADTIGDFLITGSVDSNSPFLFAKNDVGLAPVEVCYSGSACSVEESLNADSGNSGGAYNGLTATRLFGLLHISGPSFEVADATAGAPYEHLSAIAINGLLLGEDNSGRMLFEMNLQGTGHLTLDGTASADGRSVNFRSALTEFSGTVTPTPEPSSLAFLSIVSGLAVFCLRRAKKSSR